MNEWVNERMNEWMNDWLEFTEVCISSVDRIDWEGNKTGIKKENPSELQKTNPLYIIVPK